MAHKPVQLDLQFISGKHELQIGPVGMAVSVLRQLGGKNAASSHALCSSSSSSGGGCSHKARCYDFNNVTQLLIIM